MTMTNDTPTTAAQARAQDATPAGKQPARLGATHSVRVCFGRRWLSPELAGQLRVGSILELDASASAPAEVYVDGRLAGVGTPLVVEGRLCVRLERKA